MRSSRWGTPHDKLPGWRTVEAVTSAWDQAMMLLGSRMTTSRLDPWTSELVRQLGILGALDRPAVGASRRPEIRASAGVYNDWTSAHMFEPGAVHADRAIKSIVMEVRTWLSVGEDGLTSARNWVGEILIERINDNSRSGLVGACRRVAPGLLPGNPERSARQAAAWWLARDGR